MNYLTSQPTETGSSEDLNAEQWSRLESIAGKIDELNSAIATAVDSGLIVEIVRSRRYHAEDCGWGDQLAPHATKRQ